MKRSLAQILGNVRKNFVSVKANLFHGSYSVALEVKGECVANVQAIVSFLDATKILRESEATDKGGDWGDYKSWSSTVKRGVAYNFVPPCDFGKQKPAAAIQSPENFNP